MLLAVLVGSACSTTPARSDPTPTSPGNSSVTLSPAQRAQKNYEQAKQGCWFRHGYDEAKENPGAPMVTTDATGTGNSAADVAFRACLQKAKAALDRELTAANTSQ
jgi:hypothetical protein